MEAVFFKTPFSEERITNREKIQKHYRYNLSQRGKCSLIVFCKACTPTTFSGSVSINRIPLTLLQPVEMCEKDSEQREDTSKFIYYGLLIFIWNFLLGLLFLLLFIPYHIVKYYFESNEKPFSEAFNNDTKFSKWITIGTFHFISFFKLFRI